MPVINNSAYGTKNPIFGVQQKPIISKNTNPTAATQAQLGTLWINKATNATYVLTSVVAGVANWANFTGGAGVFTSLTVNPGNLTVTAGNIVASAGNITATLGNIAATAGSITAGTFVQAPLFVPLEALNDALGASVGFEKSRAGAIVHNGDALGSIQFSGWDGAAFTNGASILATTSGTIAAGRMPTDLTFFTAPDAVAAPTPRVGIPAGGGLHIDLPDVGAPIVLPGPVNIYTGAGVPANILAVNAGDFYLNTTPTMATDRLFVATGAGAWTNVTCAA